MTTKAVRRAAATSILALSYLGAAPAATGAVAAPASATTTATTTAATTATATTSIATGLIDCRRAAATTTSMRLKVLYALADPACRQTLEFWAPIVVHDAGAMAARICARAQQPDGYLYRWMVYFISGGVASTCGP